MKAIEQCFPDPVVTFIMLYKVVLTFVYISTNNELTSLITSPVPRAREKLGFRLQDSLRTGFQSDGGSYEEGKPARILQNRGCRPQEPADSLACQLSNFNRSQT